MHTYRTRFAKEIIAEFLPPSRVVKKQRVVILCDGAPSMPNKKELLKFFSKKGFWAIHIHYRGSWESDGKFLAKPPHVDVLDVVKQLPKGFTELWGNQRFKVNPTGVYVIGASFGGTTAILASLDNRITKVVAISPMIDWQKPGPDEPYSKMIKFFKQAFGNAYRLHPQAWNRLKSGKFFNPIHHQNVIDGQKLLVIHAKDDRSCPYRVAKQFASKTNAKLVSLARGGHLSSTIILKPRFYKLFLNFIKS